MCRILHRLQIQDDHHHIKLKQQDPERIIERGYMSVTIRDLKGYQNMLTLMGELDDEIAAEYDTYKSPSFSRISTAASPSTKSPQERALQRIQKLEKKQQHLEERMEEINEFVYDISDPFVMAAVRDHYIRGLTWEATCAQLNYRYSRSVTINKVNEYFRQCAAESEDLNQPTGDTQKGRNQALSDICG